MALSPPFVVRVEKKPVWFKPVAKADTGVGFEIGFNSEDDANRFQHEFAMR